jgi:hypothetical protein
MKGHQDSKIAYANLPLPAQPNIDVDCLLVGTFLLLEHPILILHTPLFPSGKVQLLLCSTPISQNLLGFFASTKVIVPCVHIYLITSAGATGWCDIVVDSATTLGPF